MLVTIDVVEEETALTLTASEQPIDMTDVIGQLQQPCLRRLVALPCQGQVGQVLRVVAQRQQFFAAVDGPRQFVMVFIVLNMVNHFYTSFFSLLVNSG